MGYGKALLAAGILVLIFGIWVKANWLGAIGILMIIASFFIGLIMTAIDPWLQGKKAKEQQKQIEDIKKTIAEGKDSEKRTE
jgi:hypothetical protein